MNLSKKTQSVKNIISNNLNFDDRYIPDRKVLQSVIKILKDAGYKIVLTQGVYDLFHVGHKRYLELAKGYGDVLIVGVDTDELTKIRKGPNRPFDTLINRLEILASLRAVDIVTVRNHHEDIDDLIIMVKPDVLILSGTTADFKTSISKLEKYCGKIKIIPAQASTSTTAKLRKMMIGGAEQLSIKIINLINDFLKGVNNESSNSVSTSNSRRTSKVLPKAKSRRAIRTRKKPNK